MAASENKENLGKHSKKQEKQRKKQEQSKNNKVFLVFSWFSEIISGRTGQFPGKTRAYWSIILVRTLS